MDHNKILGTVSRKSSFVWTIIKSSALSVKRVYLCECDHNKIFLGTVSIKSSFVWIIIKSSCGPSD